MQIHTHTYFGTLGQFLPSLNSFWLAAVNHCSMLSRAALRATLKLTRFVSTATLLAAWNNLLHSAHGITIDMAPLTQIVRSHRSISTGGTTRPKIVKYQHHLQTIYESSTSLIFSEEMPEVKPYTVSEHSKNLSIQLQVVGSNVEWQWSCCS